MATITTIQNDLVVYILFLPNLSSVKPGRSTYTEKEKEPIHPDRGAKTITHSKLACGEFKYKH
jgi:hypothetical protein